MAQNEREPLGRDRTQAILEAVRRKLSGIGGVSLVEDHNGAWGPLGATYITLRLNVDKVPVEVLMLVQGVTDCTVEDRARYDRECPQ